MKLLDAIKKRQSIRRYSTKKPDWRKILRALDAARFAPTAGNNFVMKFIVVSDKQKIESLANEASQEFIKTAHYVIIAVSDEKKLLRRYGDRGTRYSNQQAGAAIQNFLLALEEQKLSTCWIGFYNDENIKALLGIPEDKVIEAIFPIGIATKIKTKKQKKRELENHLNFEKWGKKHMTEDEKIRISA